MRKMIDSPNKAYHAGKSEWNGMQHLNNHFLGFELLVKGEHDYASFSKRIQEKDAYTEEQFQTALEVCKWWMKEYDIPIENVVRHSDVSGDDVRGEGKGKIDVGAGFDWERFKYELGE
jgi:N-acetylmuramoyl-L-alanine amidase